MAGRNGRGPVGREPITGRGFGPCGSGYNSPRSRLVGRPGYGSGLGRRFGYSDRMDRDIIEQEKAILESRLKNINDLLDELENED